MLSSELLKFQKDIMDIMQKASEKAAIDAFEETIESTGVIDIDNNITKEIKKTAKKFGKKFGSTFSNEVSADLAKAIMNYIKSAEIMITCQPTALTTVVSPVGPCTGSLLINKGTANIQIL